MKPTEYFATESASGPGVDLVAGRVVTLDNAEIAADLERAGYVVKNAKNMTLARARAMVAAARAALESAAADDGEDAPDGTDNPAPDAASGGETAAASDASADAGGDD